MFPGTLSIRPMAAKLIHNTEHFGKMAPYVKIKIGTMIEKTTAAKKQHMEPVWNEELVFKITNESVIDIEVKHKELIHDDLIGTATISLNTWLNSNNFSFSEWVPLFYKEKDAGSLLLEMRFTPEAGFAGVFDQNLGMNQNLGMKENVVLGPTQTKPIVTQPVISQPGLQPIVHTETINVQEQPVFIRENPLVFEKEILREKPIITEKEVITCTQPIIVEKPELRQNIINQSAQPTVIRENPIFREEAPQNLSQRPLLEGTPIVQKEQQFVRDEALYFREQPELFKKEIITEKPIIHEKDIIHVEKPVIVEKPEFIKKEFHTVEKGEFIRDQPLIHPEQQVFSNQAPVLKDTPIVHTQQAEFLQSRPEFVRENPEIFEKQIIHEKPIIHEQNILHTQKEIIRERPEVVQTRIVHQEQPILRQEPLVQQTTVQDNLLDQRNLQSGNRNLGNQQFNKNDVLLP